MSVQSSHHSASEGQEAGELAAADVDTDDASSQVNAGQAVVQEYLSGEEWIVDTVSRDGQHKVAALWRYDKGEANGAPFVYFSMVFCTLRFL